jgi:hypothetical protein
MAEAVRRFYCELLDGEEVGPGCFAVAGVLIETGHERRNQTLRAPVKNPESVAARCWNAGHRVVVDDAGGSTAAVIAVLDPFGLRIELERVPR